MVMKVNRVMVMMMVVMKSSVMRDGDGRDEVFSNEGWR